MLFALICKDKPGALQTRLDNRPDHVAYLEKRNAEGVLRLAGPFLDGDGKPCGSLLVYEAKDKATAERYAAEDPYTQAGLFGSTEIHPWNWTFNKPEGL